MYGCFYMQNKADSKHYDEPLFKQSLMYDNVGQESMLNHYMYMINSFFVLNINILLTGQKRSSTDDVEVVMCPASGSPGYYCNSDVSSNFFSSSHFFFILQQLALEESVVYVFFLF